MLKRNIIILFILIVLFVSCSKDNVDDKSINIEQETVIGDQNGEAVETETEESIDTVNIYMGLNYYSEPNKGLLGLIPAGEILSATGKIEESGKYEYYEFIRGNGERGWALSNYLFFNTKPAVIKPVKDIFLFDKNNDSSISRIEISPFRIVAVDSELKDDVFSKISWKVMDEYNVKSKFVVTEDLSFEKDDIEFAKIITKYLKEDNDNIKKELVSTLKELTNICSEYRDYLEIVESSSNEYLVPDVSEISMKYQDNVTFFQGSTQLTLAENATILDKSEDFKYALLEYLILNSNYSNETVSLELYNTSSFNIATIPAEVQITVGDKNYYSGIIGSLDILSEDSIELKLKGPFSEEISQEDIKVNILFVNGYVVSSSLIIVDGEK